MTRRCGDLDTGEAFAATVERWWAVGQRPNPGAWLAAADRKAIGRIQRESERDDK